jgi:hypothetical protein
MPPALFRRRVARLLPEVRPDADVPQGQVAPVVVVRFLRAPCASHGGDDLPPFGYVVAPLVLRDVPHDQHSLRRIREHLERELGVTYKTSWRMANLIRNKLMVADGDEPLSGEVEVDETFIGGKVRSSAADAFAPWSSPIVKPSRSEPTSAGSCCLRRA